MLLLRIGKCGVRYSGYVDIALAGDIPAEGYRADEVHADKICAEGATENVRYLITEHGDFGREHPAMVYNIAAVTLRQERTPDDLLGRVSSVFNLVGVGAIPVAALLAGSIAAATSTTWALLVASATCMAGLLWLVFDMGPADGPVDQGREGTHVA